jgi:hypothetical protein
MSRLTKESLRGTEILATPWRGRRRFEKKNRNKKKKKCKMRRRTKATRMGYIPPAIPFSLTVMEARMELPM